MCSVHVRCGIMNGSRQDRLMCSLVLCVNAPVREGHPSCICAHILYVCVCLREKGRHRNEWREVRKNWGSEWGKHGYEHFFNKLTVSQRGGHVTDSTLVQNSHDGSLPPFSPPLLCLLPSFHPPFLFIWLLSSFRSSSLLFVNSTPYSFLFLFSWPSILFSSCFPAFFFFSVPSLISSLSSVFAALSSLPLHPCILFPLPQRR